MNFNPSYERMMVHEGGYQLTQTPGDKGGATYAGIARNHWPHWSGWVEIDAGRLPPQAWVEAFYREHFWDALRCGEMSAEVGDAVFNFAVNAGVSTSAKLAQIVVGVRADGVIGAKTLQALAQMDTALFLAYFSLAKIQRYAAICNKDRTQSQFLLGWINRTLSQT